ncbi:hypothetical protein OAK57_02040 [Synechococcus sp. AH-551-N23]|nr:hypothetical protein [Synechococcus sp. AH-551-N23]
MPLNTRRTLNLRKELLIAIRANDANGINHWPIALASSALEIMISIGISHQLRRIPSVARIIQITNHLPLTHYFLLPLQQGA